MPLLAQIQDHTLWLPNLGPDSVVLDFGAHKGRFAQQMIDRFGSTVHAIEANPALIEKIAPHPRLTIHELALAGASGRLRFHISPNPEASSLLDSAAKGELSEVEVEAVTLESFLRSQNLDRVDVVKLDIEGAE